MSVALNVVIILGVVIAGGFLLFFLGDFLMNFFEEKKTKSEATKIYVQPAVEENKEPELTQGIVQAYNPEAEEEKEKPVEEVEEEAEEQLEDEEEMRIAEARAALERRKQEILKRMQAQLEEDEEEEEEEVEEESQDETVEDVVEESEEIQEETEEEEIDNVQEEVVENEESEEEEQEEVGVLSTEEELIEENEVVPAVDTDALQAEIEKLKNELGLQKEKNEMLEKELAEKSEVVEVETVTLGSKEDYERELAEKQAKLKVVEKEFKQVKKDYIPLYRVHKNLEKDEKKLHRREAIVAKQKVVLYGVNNYADIDEEKAKKLAEDLDLLDGLKLSVNHCKEVVEQNKERYPILEKLYNTLKSQVEGLKLEIEELENTIENFDTEGASTEE